MAVIKRKKVDLSFGSSKHNPQGLKFSCEYDEDSKTSYGHIVIPSHFQSHHTDVVHPGILAVLLDEVMIKICHFMNLEVITHELNIRFLQPAFVEEPLHVRGYFLRRTKRLIETQGEIENDLGKIIARAKAKYVETTQEEIEKARVL